MNEQDITTLPNSPGVILHVAIDLDIDEYDKLVEMRIAGTEKAHR